MTNGVCCPICGQAAQERGGCRHLRWTPRRGDPIDFAKSVVAANPGTDGSGFNPSSITQEWWESQFDWLMDRITARIEVLDGYCFGDPVDLDRLRLDIRHRFAPQPDRLDPPKAYWAEKGERAPDGEPSLGAS